MGGSQQQRPKWDVIGVGANSVDYVYRIPTSPGGVSSQAKLRIAAHTVSCGGQVTTALSTCAAMGLRTKYIGTMGADDAARNMRLELERRGIDIEDVRVRETANPYAIILVAEDTGERIVLWSRSESLRLDPADLPANRLREARLVHVDDVDEGAAIEAARIAAASGVPVTSDIERVTPSTWKLLAAVKIPIFAEDVPTALTGESHIEAALRRIRSQHDGLLCVTLGAGGAIMLEGERLHRAPGIRVAALDTTGAGDIFRGALIAALLRRDQPADALRFANAAAALSCTRAGAMSSVPTAAEVEEFLAAVSRPSTLS